MNGMTDFLTSVSQIVDKDNLYTDELRRLAWGTDAGFYRLVPQVVVRSRSEYEVSQILKTASQYNVPVTFRAAGTSLSGQAISDSVLVVAGKHWEGISTDDGGQTVTLQPGVVGSKVNDFLRPYGRKFGPDPASIKSCMVGGIVMNNASGMSCGTWANSDRMLLSGRVVFADGTVLDTADKESRQAFMRSHPEIVSAIEELRDEVLGDKELTERIRHKYSIKNVTGLNLLPLITFEDPFDIILHLLVGSEGTLAFLSQVRMSTLKMAPLQANAMVYFRDMQFLYGVVITLWMYLTPLFYPVSIIPDELFVFYKLNPMYQYVTFFRTLVLEARVPSLEGWLFAVGYAVGFLFVGTLVFRALKKKFILYV